MRQKNQMTNLFCDESGFTGQDLLNRDQPYFSYSSVLIDPLEADEIVAQVKADFPLGKELKGSRMLSNSPGRKAAEFIFDKLAHRSITVVADKRFALAGKAVQTLKNLKWGLSAIFEAAIKYGYITFNPARGTDLPPEEIKEPKQLPTGDQLNRLVERLQEPASTAVWLVAVSSIRPEELAFKWKDLDAGRRMLWVVRAVILVSADPGGAPPSFDGLGGRVHDRIREEMKCVLSENGPISFLDHVASEMLGEARDWFRFANLAEQRVIADGSGVLVLTWRGDWLNDALALLLTARGSETSNEGVALRVSSASVDRVLVRTKKVVVISCGSNNTYGHPHPDTLRCVRQGGGDIYCTERRLRGTRSSRGDGHVDMTVTHLHGAAKKIWHERSDEARSGSIAVEAQADGGITVDCTSGDCSKRLSHHNCCIEQRTTQQLLLLN
jgi:hypothetical protein